MDGPENMREDALIETLLGHVPIVDDVAGPGDDCAVLHRGEGPLELLKTDAIVEGVHWTAGTTPKRIGWKAVARVISDFAAMGGKPKEFLITLVIPRSTSIDWLIQLYQGIGACLNQYGGVVAGGETSSGPEGSPIVISVAATGEVLSDHLTLRSGANANDMLFVTGKLGGSITGKHLDFKPRLKEAMWLTECFRPTAMMDISDGLAADLPRLAAASGCGVKFDLGRIPCSDGTGIEEALHDGEDYELLFAIQSEKVEALLKAWRKQFSDLSLTAIGKLCAKEKGMPLQGGWDHFSEPVS